MTQLTKGTRDMLARLTHHLPVRADVTEVEYTRGPTPAEVRRGYGCTHYRTFPLEEACHKGTRFLKKWFKADDGLRYYR